MSFSSPVAGWIAFGVSCGAVITAIAGVSTARQLGQRVGCVRAQ